MWLWANLKNCYHSVGCGYYIIVRYIFIFSLSVYLIVVPLTFIIPFGLKIMSDYPNILLMFLFLNLLLWMGTEMYQSVSIFRQIYKNFAKVRFQIKRHIFNR